MKNSTASVEQTFSEDGWEKRNEQGIHNVLKSAQLDEKANKISKDIHKRANVLSQLGTTEEKIYIHIWTRKLELGTEKHIIDLT